MVRVRRFGKASGGHVKGGATAAAAAVMAAAMALLTAPALVHAKTAAAALPSSGVLGALQSVPQLSAYAQLLRLAQPATDYVSFIGRVVQAYGGITILAPNNAALQNLGPYTACLGNYSSSGPMTTTIANHHTLLGKWPSATLITNTTYYALDNSHPLVIKNATGEFVDGVTIIRPDLAIEADGVIHEIATVLLTPQLSSALAAVCWR